MKKLVSILLALLVTLSASPAVYAVSPDLGEENSDAVFDVSISTDRTACYDRGGMLVVVLKITNITYEIGLSGVQFDFIYNPDQLSLANDLVESDYNKVNCVQNAPDRVEWENLSHTDHYVNDSGIAVPTNSGEVTVAAVVAWTYEGLNAKADGDLEFHLYFDIKTDAEEDLQLYVRHGSVRGITNTEDDIVQHRGNGGAVTVSAHIPDGSLSCESDVKCTKCKKVITKKTSHSYLDYIPNGDATCKRNETATAECIYGCGQTDTRDIPNSAVGHKYTSYTSNGDAGCEEDGTLVAYCDYGCGTKDVRQDFGTAIGHSFTNYISDNNATCRKNCTETATCDNGCGATDTRDIPDSAVSHKYTEYVYNNDAKCGVDGSKTALCDYGCGTEDTKTAVGTALTHSYTDYVPDGNATCIADGTKTALCDRGCGSSDTLPDVGSSETAPHTPGEGATCTTPQFCTLCSTEITGSVGHSFTNYISDNNATCLKNCTETAKCDACDATDTRDIEGTRLSHEFTEYTYNNDAKCGVDGSETALCDRDCGTEDTKTAVGTALTHSYTDYVPDGNASFESDGTKTALCDHGCGSSDTLPDVGSKIEVLIGDIYQDGELNSFDYVLLKRHILRTYTITEADRLYAADIDRSKSVDATDYALLKRIILGTYRIG